jgi:hypothetical protein
LRTYLLPEPIVLDYRESYGGCKSWIGLEEAVPTAGSRPALEDPAFEELVRPTLGVIEGLAPAPMGR